jgi:hypothetical protein
MAESQEPIEYDTQLLAALEGGLSRPRLSTYVTAASGDQRRAMLLYLWNCRLAKAFLFPLNIAEVATRNSMHRALSDEFGGPQWILDPPFPLTAESQASRERALSRLKNGPHSDGLVAALTFDFWSNLFRREYSAVWVRPGLLTATFPNLAASDGRHEIQQLVAKINHLRNRIAHHEPIHALNLREQYDAILALIGHLCSKTRDWVRSHSTCMTVMRTPPCEESHLPGLPLSSTNLHTPLTLSEETPLLAAARPPVALVPNSKSGGTRLVSPTRIIRFIAKRATTQGEMIDLSEHTLGDVVAATPEILTATISRQASTGDALELFFPSGVPQAARPQALLVQSNNQTHGVILHPSIRYH